MIYELKLCLGVQKLCAYSFLNLNSQYTTYFNLKNI